MKVPCTLLLKGKSELVDVLYQELKKNMYDYECKQTWNCLKRNVFSFLPSVQPTIWRTKIIASQFFCNVKGFRFENSSWYRDVVASCIYEPFVTSFVDTFIRWSSKSDSLIHRFVFSFSTSLTASVSVYYAFWLRRHMNYLCRSPWGFCTSPWWFLRQAFFLGREYWPLINA